jgi:endonuclease YncB( thermonuclease family)
MRITAMAVAATLAASGAMADCIDINADDTARLNEIVHIDGARAAAIETGRPWPSVGSLTAIHGIGRARIRDILAEGLACVGKKAAAGERERLAGVATVLDADTFIVAEARVRLIGIDAPEGRQLCQLLDHEWPCGQAATTAVDELVGTDAVACDVYGYDRWNRALAVCYQNGVDLNAEIVRSGWALAWYPETGAVVGPSYDAAQEEAELKAAGIWQGAFLDPWAWRRQTN